MTTKQDWTEQNLNNFLSRIRFDFITQIVKKMDVLEITQAELAKKLNLTEGGVSQMLNNSDNMTLKSIVKYSRALGLKVSIVAYDDNDPDNNKGLINSEVFNICWEKQGKPQNCFDLSQISENKSGHYFKSASIKSVIYVQKAGNLISTDAWTNPMEFDQVETKCQVETKGVAA